MLLASWQAAAPCPAQQRPGQQKQQRRPLPACRANYRWSADTDGGRKRESLYGFDERSESVGGGRGGNQGANNSASSSQLAAEWGQGPQGAAADSEAQQAEWEAAAAAIASERAARRAARRAAGGGRLSRRQQQFGQQEQGPVQPAEQQAAWRQAPGPQWEPVPAGPTPDGGDPWAEADLRLLRRRQRAARRRGAVGDGVPAAAAEAGEAAAGAPGAGQLGGSGRGSTVPDPWEAEWGPAAPAASSAVAGDWGWAEESWAQDGGRRQRQRQRQQEVQEQAASEAGPGSAWDFAQQQAELRRRRRRRRRSAADEEAEDADASNAGSVGGQQAGNGAQPAGDFLGADFDYIDSSEDEDDEIGWQPGQQGQGAGYSAEFEPGVTVEPDVAVLSTDEVDRVLPVVPFSQQAAYFSGSATDSVQRWGASLAATVILSKVAVLAASSLTWPLWWPWALAARKNLAVRRQYRYGGLWRTRVLGVTFTGRPKPFGPSGDPGGLLGGSTMRLARVLIGDPGGAQAELVLAYDARYELIQPGEPAELVVLSSDPSFQQFKAVKDVYLPNSGLWVSEYPHADRTQFLDVSLQVEREAQEAQQQSQQQQPYEQAYEQEPYEVGGDGEPRYGRSYGPGGAGGWPGDGYSQPHY
ncbi:hypothetical protein ABPG77_010400 [Micractinium sp. CCAP 211/92]